MSTLYIFVKIGIIGKQFRDLKLADRFYFENDDPSTSRRKRDTTDEAGVIRFSLKQLNAIRSVTLSQIIAQNSGIGSLQSFVFSVPDNGANSPTNQNSNPLDLGLWFNPNDQYLDGAPFVSFNLTYAFFDYSFSNSSKVSLALSFSDLTSSKHSIYRNS